MKIETTKEEMLERFKLYGEIYMFLAPLREEDYMDGFSIDSYDIVSTLDLEDEIFIQKNGEEIWFRGIEFEDEMLNILYTDEIYSKESVCPVIDLESESIREVKSILEQYVKAISHE